MAVESIKNWVTSQTWMVWFYA